VFPVRCRLNLYVLFRRNSVYEWLINYITLNVTVSATVSRVIPSILRTVLQK
jgi:hypothetical protein